MKKKGLYKNAWLQALVLFASATSIPLFYEGILTQVKKF